MTFIVTDKCVKCKYTDCVEVCPVDCFREGENMLVIDPDECIDCNLCVPECPIDAIYAEDDLPENKQHFLGINAKLAKQWPEITVIKDPPLDADDYKDIADKEDLLCKSLGVESLHDI